MLGTFINQRIDNSKLELKSFSLAVNNNPFNGIFKR